MYDEFYEKACKIIDSIQIWDELNEEAKRGPFISSFNMNKHT
jgi:hypothetical protein